MIEIDEVLGRAEQGVTEPYICRAADKKIYYVKGKGAGYSSLTKEWIAGNLAVAFGLPVASFSILSMPKALFDYGKEGFLGDLGYGPVFGSQKLDNVNEISMTNIADLDCAAMRDIAVFDWWVMNGDRTLSENGGNPNILWSASLLRPFIIDHNLAFDNSVTLHSLEVSHIFGSTLRDVLGDGDLQEHYRQKFEICLAKVVKAYGDIPERWRYLDDQQTMETDFSSVTAEDVLRRFEKQNIWELV